MKTKYIQFRCTEQEHELITNCAKILGSNKSRLIMNSVISSLEHEKNYIDNISLQLRIYKSESKIKTIEASELQ